MNNKNKLRNVAGTFTIATMLLVFSSCDKKNETTSFSNTITIENVLNSKPLVQSGIFKGTSSPPVIFPGASVSISFYATKGQAVTFATMYGWSNDLFFAPDNPGIKLYNNDGSPVTGDVSSQIKLWDNGTRINQPPGMNVSHPGTAEASPKNISEVRGMDAQGNIYRIASDLVKTTLAYDGNSKFTLTIRNTSGGTANETPLSPGAWAISYIAGNDLLNPMPIYTNGQLSINGLTNLAEAGNNEPLGTYLTSITGIFTPLSPVLVVVYQGEENPFYKVGENDRGEGLKELAQKGNADILAAKLQTKSNVKKVYILNDRMNTVLLPAMGVKAGDKVSQQLTLSKGDRIAIATMYGFSNDWYFATKGNGIDATIKGNVSDNIELYDNGTAIDQYPGAGITQAVFGGTPLPENKPIQAVSNPNAYTTLPPINKIIKVTIN